jgi:hypothetical protein
LIDFSIVKFRNHILKSSKGFQAWQDCRRKINKSDLDILLIFIRNKRYEKIKDSTNQYCICKGKVIDTELICGGGLFC